MFHLRVRVSAIRSLDQLRMVLDARCQRYLMYHESVVENSENDHLQGVVTTHFKEITLRKAIAEILTVKGNRAYSISALRKDHDTAAQYVTKDGRRWNVKGYPDDELERLEAVGRERKHALMTPSEKKKSSSVVDWLYEEVMSRAGVAPFSSNGIQALMKAVIDVYISSGKMYPYGRERPLVLSLKLRWLQANDSAQYEVVRDRLVAAATDDLQNYFLN